jgi:hypothetical protein
MAWGRHLFRGELFVWGPLSNECPSSQVPHSMQYCISRCERYFLLETLRGLGLEELACRKKESKQTLPTRNEYDFETPQRGPLLGLLTLRTRGTKYAKTCTQ